MLSIPIRLEDSLAINISRRKILDFLLRVIYQRKIASKNTAIGCVYPGVRSHELAGACRRRGGGVTLSGGSTATLKNNSE